MTKHKKLRLLERLISLASKKMHVQESKRCVRNGVECIIITELMIAGVIMIAAHFAQGIIPSFFRNAGAFQEQLADA